MKQAIVVLAEGFEEIEALGTADILNRCGIMTMLAGISGSIVSGAHDIRVAPDMFLEHTPGSDAAAIILPDEQTFERLRRRIPKARVTVIPDPHAELVPDAFTFGEFAQALAHVYTYVQCPKER
jgi:putative intracellular protease/amidase